MKDLKIPQGQTRFIVIEQEAKSLYKLIAGEVYLKTNLGRDEWKKLVGPLACVAGGIV